MELRKVNAKKILASNKSSASNAIPGSSKINVSADKPSIPCPSCVQTFTKRSNLRRHIHRKHNSDPDLIRSASVHGSGICLQCGQNFNQSSYLKKHLKNAHGMEFKEKTRLFLNDAEFVAWKKQMEKETFSAYTKQSGMTLWNGIKRQLYVCNRSGCYRPRCDVDNRRRRLKASGSLKLNRQCTSSIKVNYKQDGDLEVLFCETHYGHDNLREFKNRCPVKRIRQTKKRKVDSGSPPVESIPTPYLESVSTLKSSVISALNGLLVGVQHCTSYVAMSSLEGMLTEIKTAFETAVAVDSVRNGKKHTKKSTNTRRKYPPKRRRSNNPNLPGPNMLDPNLPGPSNLTLIDDAIYAEVETPTMSTGSENIHVQLQRILEDIHDKSFLQGAV